MVEFFFLSREKEVYLVGGFFGGSLVVVFKFFM